MELKTLGRLGLKDSKKKDLDLTQNLKVPLLLLAYLVIEGPKVSRENLAYVFWGEDSTPYPPKVHTKLSRWLYKSFFETYQTGELVYSLDDLEKIQNELHLSARLRQRDIFDALEQFKKGNKIILDFHKSQGELLVTLNAAHFKDAVRKEQPQLRSLRNHLAKLRKLLSGSEDIISADNRQITVQNITSDFIALAQAVDEGDYQKALLIGGDGEFLSHIRSKENVARSKLSEHFFEWIDVQRARVAGLIARSHLELARRARVNNQPDEVATHSRYIRTIIGKYEGAISDIENIERELGRIEMPIQSDKTSQQQAPTSVVESEVPYKFSDLGGRLFGRLPALKQVLRLMELNDIVTLVGPPGVGKTSLAKAALETARATPVRYSHVAFVDLEGITSVPSQDETLILDLISQALSVPTGFQPILHAVNAKSGLTLVVLNNVEQFLGEGSVFCEVVLRLSRIEKLRLLLTSREKIPELDDVGVQHSVPNLKVPEVGAKFTSLAQARQDSPAVDLFVHRMEQLGVPVPNTKEHFQHLLRVVRLLEGLPLALRIVAGQTENRTLGEIFKELEAASQGKAVTFDTTRVFESALRHLPCELRKSFRMLSIFPGWFSREAALAVIGESGQVALEQLRLKNLLNKAPSNEVSQRGRELFSIHPLLKAYAQSQLRSRKEEIAQTNERFASYYAGLIPTLAADVVATDNLNKLGAEEESFLAFLEYAVEVGQLEQANRVIEPILWHFYRAGRYDRGTSTFSRVASKLNPNISEHRLSLGFLNCARAWLEHWNDDFAEAEKCARIGIDYIREFAPNHRVILIGYGALQANLYRQGRYRECAKLIEEIIELGRVNEDDTSFLQAISASSWNYVLGGAYDKVDIALTEAKRIIGNRRLGEHIFVAEYLTLEGFLKVCRGDISEGLELLRRGQGVCLEVGHVSQFLVNCNFSLAGQLLLAFKLVGLAERHEEVQAIIKQVREQGEVMRATTQHTKSRVLYAFVMASIAATEAYSGSIENADSAFLESISESWLSKNIACTTYALSLLSLIKINGLEVESGCRIAGCLISASETVEFCRQMLLDAVSNAKQAFPKMGVSEDQIEKWLDEGRSLELTNIVNQVLGNRAVSQFRLEPRKV